MSRSHSRSLPPSSHARARRALPLLLLLSVATALPGCRGRSKTQPAPDPAPVLGVWSGREGRSYGGYREWRLEVKPENLMRPDRKTTPGLGRYVERGVVCEVEFIGDFYPGAVPRINFVIAGKSGFCATQRFTLHGAVPIGDMLVGQLTAGTEDQYASITFRREAAAAGAAGSAATPADSGSARSPGPPAP